MKHGDRQETFKKGFSTTADLLSHYKLENPDATVALEKDTKGLFFRSFISNPVAIGAQTCNFPVAGVDAAHSRCPEYNGVHLLMIGRNSDGKNVIYGHALVPKETKRNYIWFFSRMIEAGFDFTIVVIFIDRGFARNAAEYIFEVY